jgi:hypothetical protein
VLVSVALAAASVLSVGEASAHAVGLSRGEYVVRGRAVTADVTLARKDAEAFVSAADLAREILVSTGGSACAAAEERFVDAPPDGVTMHARYDCPAPLTVVEVDAPFVRSLPFGHRHLVHASAGPGNALDDVLMRDHASFSVRAGSAASESPPATWAGALSLVRMGVEHIVTGYDHLLFLLGLVLASRNVRALLGAVSAFTAAHSVTLAAATLGWWAPPPALVEPLITASIAYVGLENVFVLPARGRWYVAFPFGLVHGFGFAGALRAVHFARPSTPLVLGAFNLGVELGQLAVLGAIVPVLLLLRRRAWFEGAGLVALNGAVAATGLAWTIVRVFGGAT